MMCSRRFQLLQQVQFYPDPTPYRLTTYPQLLAFTSWSIKSGLTMARPGLPSIQICSGPGKAGAPETMISKKFHVR